MATIVAQERSPRELAPPSVRAMILARLAKLAQSACQLVRANAVLGTMATAERLWQVAELEVQAGLEALEEAVRSGILREEAPGRGRPAIYGFAHELMRDVVYTELGEAAALAPACPGQAPERRRTGRRVGVSCEGLRRG
jgi:hypothetical protein